MMETNEKVTLDNNIDTGKKSVIDSNEPGYRIDVKKKSGKTMNEIKLEERKQTRQANDDLLRNPEENTDYTGVNSQIIKTGIDNMANALISKENNDVDDSALQDDLAAYDQQFGPSDMEQPSDNDGFGGADASFGGDFDGGGGDMFMGGGQDPNAAAFAQDPLFDGDSLEDFTSNVDNINAEEDASNAETDEFDGLLGGESPADAVNADNNPVVEGDDPPPLS